MKCWLLSVPNTNFLPPLFSSDQEIKFHVFFWFKRGFGSQSSITLIHMIPWLVKQCGRPSSESRHRCMRLICKLAPLLPGIVLIAVNNLYYRGGRTLQGIEVYFDPSALILFWNTTIISRTQQSFEKEEMWVVCVCICAENGAMLLVAIWWWENRYKLV